MTKDSIFSKINLRDYNNTLEIILEQKNFSEDVKNLLLSMLYKIENGYEDYKTVKINVTNKNYFLNKIIQIIKERCKEIIIVKPFTKESAELEEKNVNYIVDKEKGKIKVYQNERMMLEALVILNQNEIELEQEYKIFEEGLREVLLIGNKMNQAEVIRDFNGWSWDITTSQIESKNINLVYQNLVILLGQKFLQSWISDESKQEDKEVELPNNEILRSKYNESFGITVQEMRENNKIDYYKNMEHILKNKFGEEIAKDFIDQLIKTVIAIGCSKNEKYKNIIIKQKNDIEKELEKMKDNKKYLEELSKQKKENNIRIKKIDTILRDEKLLKEEYEKRNSNLPNKEKIFSVSHLIIMLEKERKELLEKIKICNKKMEPTEYVDTKLILQENSEYYNEIGISNNEKINISQQIEKLQLKFLSCIEKQLKHIDNKIDITKLLYEIRYYKQIPLKKGNIGNNKTIKTKLENIEKDLITKSCNHKIINAFSENNELNYKILEPIFNSKIVDLKNIIYILKYHKGILKIAIYDTNIQEDNIEIQITKKTELKVKLNKKIKLWQ